jgi:hypothetical protein
VEIRGFVGGEQPDRHQVEGANEAVADAKATGAGDRIPERHRPVMLQQDEGGGGVVRDVLQDVPGVLLGERLDALGRRLQRSGGSRTLRTLSIRRY